MRISLAIAVLAAASPFAASAVMPKPDKAPVKTTPAPSQPSTPAPSSTPVQSHPTTSSSTRSTTTTRKHKKVVTTHKRKTRKPSAAHKKKAKQKTKSKPTPAVTPKPKPKANAAPVIPATTETPGLRSVISSIFKVSLLAVGVLLLALAALEPSLVGPPRLRKTLVDHRGDLATAGILLLISMGIAYLLVWGTAI